MGATLYCLFSSLVLIISGSQVVNHGEAPDTEIQVTVHLADRLVPQTAHELTKLGQFRSRWRPHGSHLDAPGKQVRQKIGDLDRGRQVAVNQEWLGDDPSRPRTPGRGFPKIFEHLIQKQMTSRLLDFIEHDEAERLGRNVLEKVKEAFK